MLKLKTKPSQYHNNYSSSSQDSEPHFKHIFLTQITYKIFNLLSFNNNINYIIYTTDNFNDKSIF